MVESLWLKTYGLSWIVSRGYRLVNYTILRLCFLLSNPSHFDHLWLNLQQCKLCTTMSSSEMKLMTNLLCKGWSSVYGRESSKRSLQWSVKTVLWKIFRLENCDDILPDGSFQLQISKLFNCLPSFKLITLVLVEIIRLPISALAYARLVLLANSNWRNFLKASVRF